MIARQQPHGVAGLRLGLMMPGGLQDQPVRVSANRDAQVQIAHRAVTVGLKGAAQRVAKQIGTLDLRIRLQFEPQQHSLSALTPQMFDQFIRP